METFAVRFFLVLLLGIIGFQDFKYRGISWYLFPILLGLLIWSNPHFKPELASWNIGLIIMVLIFLTFWFSFREGLWVNLLSAHLGLGDVLFLLCLGFYFSPENFLLFYILSLACIALGSFLYSHFFSRSEFTIPLAGLQGAVLMGCLLWGWSAGMEIANVDFLTRLR